jgi:hypothetical protein
MDAYKIPEEFREYIEQMVDSPSGIPTLTPRSAAGELELCTLVYIAERVLRDMYDVSGKNMVSLVVNNIVNIQNCEWGNCNGTARVYYHPNDVAPWDFRYDGESHYGGQEKLAEALDAWLRWHKARSQAQQGVKRPRAAAAGSKGARGR